LTRSLDQQLAMFERHLIEEALIRGSGRAAVASERLGAPKKTLYDKINRLGLSTEDFKLVIPGEMVLHLSSAQSRGISLRRLQRPHSGLALDVADRLLRVASRRSVAAGTGCGLSAIPLLGRSNLGSYAPAHGPAQREYAPDATIGMIVRLDRLIVCVRST